MVVLVIQAENKTLTFSPIGLESIQGAHVKLIRSGPEYTDFIYTCYKDNEFMNLYRLAQDRKLTKSEINERLVAEQNKLPQELKRIEWVIIKHNEHQQIPIGLAALADYQGNHRRAEFLLGIQDERYRKGLLSIEASLLVLDFAFNKAGLHKVVSFVYGYNKHAQKNTIHLGFFQEGVLKDHIYCNNEFVDLFQNAMFKADFSNNNLLKKLSLRLLGCDVTQSKKVTVSSVSKELIEKLNKQFKTM